MHYSGLVYRPPYEAESVLIQVTRGCSHNSCVFCAMYQKEPFDVCPMEEVLADIEEAGQCWPHAIRVFLVGGDAFVLPASRLVEIAEAIHAAIPSVETITGYARIDNIARKTDEELAQLAELGYGEINIGLESALDDVLLWMNKGYNVQTAREQLLRLQKAGMKFSVNIINAAAGPHRIKEHARANAAFINEVRPYLVFVSPLHVDDGTPLVAQIESGEFEECTLGEYVEEEIELVRNLDLDDCEFFGMHISNPVPVQGVLAQDKQRLIAELQEGIEEYPPEMRNATPKKGSEGRMRL